MKTQTIPHKPIFLTAKEKREARETYIINLCTWCGLSVAASLIGFFLVMRAFGLHEVLMLHYFNFLFLGGGILAAFLLYKRKYHYKGIRYLTGIKMGVHVCLLGLIPFCVFMGIYLAVDTDFMNYIVQNAAFGEFLTPARTAGGLFMEGFATGAVVTLSLMQLFKDEEFNPNYSK